MLTYIPKSYDLLYFFQPTVGQWQKVFYIVAGVLAFGGFVFLAFASAEREPWSYDDDDDGEGEVENRNVLFDSARTPYQINTKEIDNLACVAPP